MSSKKNAFVSGPFDWSYWYNRLQASCNVVSETAAIQSPDWAATQPWGVARGLCWLAFKMKTEAAARRQRSRTQMYGEEGDAATTKVYAW